MIANMLHSLNAFQHLSGKTMKQLAYFVKTFSFTRHCYTQHEGDPVQGISIIKHGEFEILTSYNPKTRSELWAFDHLDDAEIAELKALETTGGFEIPAFTHRKEKKYIRLS